jgi:4-amino-4-deoxy-L-arabinose transferase-like glycosyltransferase
MIIFLISFLSRFLLTWKYPPLLWDEAAIGYNAYSILKTGRDEYGQVFPLIFKSFGDYKPGLYVYLTIPFVAILGLNDLSVRLPSILIGSITPILLFFLIKILDPKNSPLAYISAIVLAFNPYNIHFSKGAWESNVLTAEMLIATILFLKHRYLPSATIFAASLYTYQAGKMLSILVIISLLLFSSRPLFKQFKALFFTFFLPLIIFALPVALGLLFNSNSNRLKVISLFSYHRPETETSQIISESNRLDYSLFHSQITYFFRNFFHRYFNHFTPRFMVFEGDWQNPRHSAPYAGMILLPSLIFLIIGFLSPLPHSRLFYFWLLSTPILSALTRDSVQSVRSHFLSIPLVYFISLGINIFLKKFSSITVYVLLITVYLFSFLYYSELYYQHLVKKSPHSWLYGYKQTAEFLISHQQQFQHIYFSDFYGQPYIFYLFYSHYPPRQYQRQAKLLENNQGDTGRIEQIDNIKFTNVDFNAIKNQPKTLAIFSYDETIRQNINKNLLIPLSPINDYSTFYAYVTP